MGLFDAVYDQLSWSEVTYRLPSELAVNALKRRIINLDTLLMFFQSCGTNKECVKAMKEHVNSVLRKETVTDILSKVKEELHPVLFTWLDKDNQKRLKEDGKDKLDIKLMFNMTEDKDDKTLGEMLDRVLEAPELKIGQVIAIINKANTEVFSKLINKIVRDARPEIRSLVLSVGTEAKRKVLGQNMLIAGLKALAKMTGDLRATDILDFNLFSSLRPKERLIALQRYLGQFPHYQKRRIFVSMPTDEELDFILFSGCISENETVVRLRELYNKIVKLDPPEEKKEE